MAFHYLNGFEQMEFISKNDKKQREDELENNKQHMCLIPFDEFKKRADELESLGFSKGNFEGYDIMIVRFIPHIITYAGFELVDV
jgi:hypothetical protein